MEKLTGLFKTEDGDLVKVSDTPDGGLIGEIWVSGKGFVSGGNIAEAHAGVELSDKEAEEFKQIIEQQKKD